MSKVFASAIDKFRLISSISLPSPSSSLSSLFSSSSSSSSVGRTRLNSQFTVVDRNVTTNAAGGGLLIQQQNQQKELLRRQSSSYFRRSFGTSTTNGGDSESGQQPNSNSNNNKNNEKVYWNEEWKRLGLGATLVDDGDGDGTSKARSGIERPKNRFPGNLFFVQLGFGVDQHGDTTNDATKACVRAVRNAIEFNSIPGVIQHIPGGRHGMLIHVKLGVPPPRLSPDVHTKEEKGESQQKLIPSYVDVAQVAKVFPYGRLLPIEVVVGGINFHSGRVVEELGDKDDVGICCVACVTIGYDDDDDDNDNDNEKDNKKNNENNTTHRTFNTKDGY